MNILFDNFTEFAFICHNNHMRIKAAIIAFALCYFAQAGQAIQKVSTLNVGLRPSQIIFTPDSKFLLCSGSSWNDDFKLNKSILQWWDVQAKTLRKTVVFRKHPISSAAITSDGKILATAHSNEIKIWDARTGRAKHILGTPATLVDFSPDGKTLATAGAPVMRKRGHATPNQIIVKLWDTTTWKLKRVLTKGDLTNGFQDSEESSFVTSIDFTPDGQTIVAATAAEIVVLWDTQSGKVQNTLMRPGYKVTFSPDGKTAAVRSEEVLTSESTYPVYSLYDVKTWKFKAGLTSKDQEQNVEQGNIDPTPGNAIAFSPDSKTVAAGFGDAFAGLYDTQTGALKQTITDDERHYSSALTFSPDGRLLASGNWTTVEIWKIK